VQCGRLFCVCVCVCVCMCVYVHVHVCVCVCVCACAEESDIHTCMRVCVYVCVCVCVYDGLVTIGRRVEIQVSFVKTFCERALFIYGSFQKETSHFIIPANQSKPINTHICGYTPSPPHHPFYPPPTPPSLSSLALPAGKLDGVFDWGPHHLQQRPQ